MVVTYVHSTNMGFLPCVDLKAGIIVLNDSIEKHFGMHVNIYAPVTVHYILIYNRCFFSFMENSCRGFHV